MGPISGMCGNTSLLALLAAAPIAAERGTTLGRAERQKLGLSAHEFVMVCAGPIR